MRARALLAFGLVALGAFTPTRVHAETPAPTAASPSPSDATVEARRHFKLGIRLYQDTNYPGALAEFEAAYAAKPGAG